MKKTGMFLAALALTVLASPLGSGPAEAAQCRVSLSAPADGTPIASCAGNQTEQGRRDGPRR